MLVEDCAAVDIRKLHREKKLDGETHIFQSRGVKIGAALKDALLVIVSGRIEPRAAKIALTWRKAPYGGSYPIMFCPVCLTRCFSLYLRNRRAACRRCQGLTYACQREHLPDRLLRRARKIRRQLGDRSDPRLPPDRVPGTHIQRYEAAALQIKALEDRAIEILAKPAFK